jgi:hypothetical protein
MGVSCNLAHERAAGTVSENDLSATDLAVCGRICGARKRPFTFGSVIPEDFKVVAGLMVVRGS